MSHEQFTRGNLACNRGVTLFCRCDMSPQFKLIWIQGTCRADKIPSPQQDFSWKSSDHMMGFVAGTVPATCPLVWADLKCALSILSTSGQQNAWAWLKPKQKAPSDLNDVAIHEAVQVLVLQEEGISITEPNLVGIPAFLMEHWLDFKKQGICCIQAFCCPDRSLLYNVYITCEYNRIFFFR